MFVHSKAELTGVNRQILLLSPILYATWLYPVKKSNTRAQTYQMMSNSEED